MQRFAELLERLLYAPQRNVKLALLVDHLATTPDPARGWALAALTGSLTLSTAKPALVRALIEQRMDPMLFRWSYDFVGDLAETVALAWPTRSDAPALDLSATIATLNGAARTAVPSVLAAMLDSLDGAGRWALLKLITGGLRVGVSAGLARQALAEWSGREIAEIEEVWHGQAPPYTALFAWLEGTAPRPEAGLDLGFRPVMLAHPLEPADLEKLEASDFAAEWKWDGIRVQLVGRGGEVVVYTRTGDDISAAVPDLLADLAFDGVFDGELLVGEASDQGWQARPFNDLQQRLNRKTVPKAMLARHPVFVRLYDLLMVAGEDLRPLPFDQRRVRLEAWVAATNAPRLDLSPAIEFTSWGELDAARQAAGHGPAIEGVMLKRRDSAYLSGRPKGLWWKWKRAAQTIDAVLMYAQRGHGKRSSFYSDYTFGCWQDGALVPVGKAYSGFTDAELAKIDRWVRDNTVKRYGPVREVAVGLVFELAFDSVQRSTRHRSGLALRFPRVARIRWDKPPADADEVATLARLIA